MKTIVKKTQYGLAALVLAMSSLVGGVAFPQQAAAYAGGNGTSGNPWQIAACAQLVSLNDSTAYRDDHFVLTANIDCLSAPVDRIAFGDDLSFTGTFDGGGFTIRNIMPTSSVNHTKGLFGHLEGATVTNLTIDNYTSSGQYRLGVLAGLASEGTIVENVHVTNSDVIGIGAHVNNTYAGIGGLVGASSNSTYENVTVDAEVRGNGNYGAGGVLGTSTEDTLEKVGAYGDVRGHWSVGGLIGHAIDTDVFWIFAKGAVVSVNEEAGGLIGTATGTSIASAYATGDVTIATGFVGGLVGLLGSGSDISYAYSTGQTIITYGEASSGGLVGTGWEATAGTTTFWDVQASGQAESFDQSQGKTTAQMKTMDTFLPEGWDFYDEPIWGLTLALNEGYPCHAWEAGCVTDDSVGGSNNTNLPNNGDGNNDGTIDAEQDNVVTLLSPVSQKYVTLAVDESCSLSDVSIANESSHTAKDTAFAYQSGFVNFTATGCDEDVANVKLYYHGVSTSGIIARKYNPNTNTYFTIESASISAAPQPLTGTLVSYAIADNSELDIDATEGVITDPVGIASMVVGAPNTGLSRQQTENHIVTGIISAGALLALALMAVMRKRYWRI